MKMFDNWEELLKYQINNNENLTVEHIVWAFSLLVILLVSFRVFRKWFLVRLKAFADKTSASLDDRLVEILEKIHPRVYDFIAVYLSLKTLHLSESIDKVLDGIFTVLIVFQLTISIQGFIAYLMHKLFVYERKQDEAEDPRRIEEGETVFKGINLFIKIVLWISALLIILANLGVNITSLSASLGIGGIAVALAVQNILGDIFSSFTIYFDKPFVIGDFIIIGTDMGTVEKIGLKTTRIRTLQGEELVVSNKELTSARIQNFKKMKKRRVIFGIGLVYETSLEQLKSVPAIVAKIFNEVEGAELDRVHFKEYADFSLNYEIVYFHLSANYTEYMDMRQEINFKIKEEFEKAGLEMAFPTQTIHVAK